MHLLMILPVIGECELWTLLVITSVTWKSQSKFCHFIIIVVVVIISYRPLINLIFDISL